MEIIYAQEGTLQGDILRQFYEGKIGEQCDNKFIAMGFLSENYIKAVAIFYNYNKSNIDLHWSGVGYLTKGYCKTIANYVFNFLKCNRLTVTAHRRQNKLINILPRLGFEQEAILKNYYGLSEDEDGLVYVLTKEKARKWLDK